MFKKILSLALVFSLSSFYAPLVTAETETQTLKEFLATTDKIQANLTYPNYIAAAKTSTTKTLAAHTPIIIRSVKTITTNDIVDGDTVTFAVVNDVKDNQGNILIKANSPVTANISFKKNGFIGKSGELTISDFHTTAIDGTYIPLSSSITAKPDDKMILSIVLSVCICPLFLLIKGDEARMESGTTKTVYTVTESNINTVRL